jgi:3-mercaptopyruvate sulfurtransferase SseA
MKVGPEIEVAIRGDFTATYRPELVSSVDDVVEVVASGAAQILDARSRARFLAQAPEPRPGRCCACTRTAHCLLITRLHASHYSLTQSTAFS